MPRVPHLENSLAIESVGSKKSVSMISGQAIVVGVAGASHDVLLFVPHLNITPEFLRVVASPEINDGRGHSGELPVGVSGGTALQLKVVDVELSHGLFKEGVPPGAAIFTLLAGDGSSIPVDCK